MSLPTLLSEFCRLHEMPAAALDEASGAFQLGFDDGKNVLRFREAARGTIQLESEVCRLDPASEGGRQTLGAALRGNLVRLSEHAGVLSWDNSAGALFLSLALERPASGVEGFSETVESFLNQVDGFRQGLEAAKH